MSHAPAATRFVPHHRLVANPEQAPANWMLVLHGIYGRGDNWRRFARELVTRRPDWGAVLVDLRMHGASTDAPPPHRMASAASDLVALEAVLGEDGRQVRAVCGHSFGAKVALAYAGARADEAGVGLPTMFIIDASPSARPGAMDDAKNPVIRVLRALEGLPGPFVSRADFVRALAARGIDETVAQWLAMGLERDSGGYHPIFDPDALASLLGDYYELDVWPVVERFADEPDGGELVVVIGGRSDVVDARDRTRFSGLAAAGGGLHVATIANAGHWVHVDALDALLDIVCQHLPRAA